MSASAARLLAKITCPHCWASFPPEKTLWISEHQELLGDPRLGRDHQERFRPSRFTLDGYALDLKGAVCRSLACPTCHLPYPRALLETPPFFVSIIGDTSCGKSFYLTTMTWSLRKVLPRKFALDFEDADLVANQTLIGHEKALFLSDQPEQGVLSKNLIDNTARVGDLYHSVTFDGQEVRFIRPFLFRLRPQEQHPQAKAARTLSRVVCLYDNAGEHFQPGQDRSSVPVTRHLAYSDVFLFLFDPTQDYRFRKLCYRNRRNLGSIVPKDVSRQDTILREMANRFRGLTALPEGAQTDRPLLVVLTKSDAWSYIIPDEDVKEPYFRPCGQAAGVVGIEVGKIERRSAQLRDILSRVSPEIVRAAETFSANVTYVPVSSLGCTPEYSTGSMLPFIRPANIKPKWVTVPMLYGLHRSLPGLLAGAGWPESTVTSQARTG